MKMHTSLSDMPRKNAFIVPEGYFEELPTAVLLKCSVSKEKKEPLRALKPLWWSVAACSLLLLGIWFVVPNSTPSSDSLLAEESYAISELQDYLAYYVPLTVIEEELNDFDMDFSFDMDFLHFYGEISDADLLAYNNALLDYLNFNDFYED